MLLSLTFKAESSELTLVDTADDGFAVVGYLPEKRLDDFVAERAVGITDLIYFGLEPMADGRLSVAPIDTVSLAQIQQIKSRVQCRVLLCVGGWGRSKAFPALASDTVARRRFIQGMLAYCRDNGFDGVDYDWEHPVDANEMEQYGTLVSETQAAFGPKGLLVTVAQAGWQDVGRRVYEAVDLIHLMSYDQDFPQATLAAAAAEIDSLTAWGCPPAKIALGLPFYGRDKERKARTYAELVGDGPVDPASDIIDGFAFNGRSTLGAKISLAHKRGLGGVMVWELGQDTHSREASLLSYLLGQVQALPSTND
jgi:chitinase